ARTGPLRRARPRALGDPDAVVSGRDDRGATGGTGRDPDDGRSVLAGRGPLGRTLGAVVDRVGDQVLEGVGDALQDAGVQLDVLSLELQADVLAGRRGHLAHQLREARDDAPYRDHRQAHGTLAHRADL